MQLMLRSTWLNMATPCTKLWACPSPKTSPTSQTSSRNQLAQLPDQEPHPYYLSWISRRHWLVWGAGHWARHCVKTFTTLEDQARPWWTLKSSRIYIHEITDHNKSDSKSRKAVGEGILCQSFCFALSVFSCPEAMVRDHCGKVVPVERMPSKVWTSPGPGSYDPKYHLLYQRSPRRASGISCCFCGLQPRLVVPCFFPRVFLFKLHSCIRIAV